MSTIIITVFLLLILGSLGSALYFMLTDKGKTNRTVKALTYRIGLSILLILLVMIGILTGIIRPHGVGG